MGGRARARGRACGQGINVPGAVGQAQEVSHPPGEGDLGDRGRQKNAPRITPAEVLQISVGFHQTTLGERGGRRQDYHDVGINTRQAIEHVKESKTGTSGRPIQLTANYFRVLSCPQWVLYQYHVDFNPQMDSRRLRTALLFQHGEALGEARIFDGSMLFLLHRLRDKETVFCSETRNGEKVQVTVTLTNELPPSSPTCLQFYNILFRRILKILNMQLIGRNYYNPHEPLSIPQHRLIIWPGFCSAILEFETSIMMCTDVSHKVLRSETVLDLMTSLRQRYGSERFFDICTKELVGLRVLTKYNNKTYKIDDIAWDHTPTNTFRRGDADVTFKDYYNSQYGLKVTDLKQALLVSHVKKRGPAGAPPPGPVMLVPEFCYLTGLTDKMRSDYVIMKDLSTHTKLNPEQRQQRLIRFVDNIQKNTDAQGELQKWGLSFDQKVLTLTGRVLPSEKISQGPNAFDYNPYEAEWNKQMRGLPLMSAPPLKNWLLLHTSRNDKEAQSLLKTLHKVSGPLGISVQRANVVVYQDHQESLLKALQQNVGPQTQMVLVVLTNDRKDKYDAVKKFLSLDCPVPSQCVLSRTISKPKILQTVATKIALQMACKMGGELWSVEIPLKQLMIVGIDCYHDTASGKRSIGALVASLNQNMSRWFSKCMLQRKGQELIDTLKMALTAAIKDYLRFNKCLPARIVVYRDGVGDGQLDSVVNYEIAQILDAIKSMGQDYAPKISVIVVKKRINSRFFAFINSKVNNPPPGTVVDTEVTRREWYDFFIVSQVAHLGSVSPTHYNVVYDTSGLKPDHMQRLTYKLCHMYYNWQGIIRVPAPCQYAHRLAFLVGQSLHKEPHMKLDDLLFYL